MKGQEGGWSTSQEQKELFALGFSKCLFEIELSVSIHYRSGLYILSSAQSRSFI